jgi:hypothetical protein
MIPLHKLSAPIVCGTRNAFPQDGYATALDARFSFFKSIFLFPVLHVRLIAFYVIPVQPVPRFAIFEVLRLSDRVCHGEQRQDRTQKAEPPPRQDYWRRHDLCELTNWLVKYSLTPYSDKFTCLFC